MPKRKRSTYGKPSKHDAYWRNNLTLFSALDNDEDVASSPPAATPKLLLKKPTINTYQDKKQSDNITKPSNTMEPSAENVALLVSMGICDLDTAKRYLKAKNNSVDQAAAAILDGEDISAAEASGAWDDSVWAADRSGRPNETDADRKLHPLASSTAPTRGPSPAGSYRQPGTRAEEDEDLAKAMAASQGDIRYGEQETGVMRADGTTAQTQGPQLANYYTNTSQWAMVPYKQSTSEIIPDVDEVERRHVSGQPRFLKNTIHGDYLPSFLTICHNIPAARELLLMTSYTRYDYGQNPEWWKGQPIVLPKVVNVSDGSPTDPLLAKYDDFLAELQRLMAFLDLSDRAYASTANLEATGDLARHAKTARTSNQSIVQTFIGELAAAAHSVNQSGAAVDEVFGLQAGSDDGAIDSRIAEMLDFDIDTNDESTNLSELLDRTLWDIDADEDEPAARFVERLPQVMVMRLRQHNQAATSLRVKAPKQLYMDKYLKENVTSMQPLRSRMLKEKQRLSKIAVVEDRLKNWKSAKHNVVLETQKLLAQTKLQCRPIAEELGAEDEDRPMVNGVVDDNDDHAIFSKLDRVISDIEEKLAVLERERTKANEVLAGLSAPSHAEEILQVLDHRYTLVGFATKPNTTYVLRPKDEVEDEADVADDQSDEETPPTMQWWRIEYAINGTKATINRNKSAGYETLPAVEFEHTSALLVYASDRALDQRLVSDYNISDSLQEFVKADNALFEDELRAQPPPPSYGFDGLENGIAMQSIERKTSLDSLQAEGGSDIEMDQDPRMHANYGLGYGPANDYSDPPTVDIAPPPAEDDSNGNPAEAVDGMKPVQSWDVRRDEHPDVRW